MLSEFECVFVETSHHELKDLISNSDVTYLFENFRERINLKVKRNKLILINYRLIIYIFIKFKLKKKDRYLSDIDIFQNILRQSYTRHLESY